MIQASSEDQVKYQRLRAGKYLRGFGNGRQRPVGDGEGVASISTCSRCAQC